MQATDREKWLLNFYRNSELHGALLMGRLARSAGNPVILVPATRHCATEARHAAMLSETIEAIGGSLDPGIETVQQRYSAKGGVPTALVDVLVLSEILERRVLSTYRAHVAREDVHPEIRRTLTAILDEMEHEEHGSEDSWIDRVLADSPRDVVEAAEARWTRVDQEVTAELERFVESRFPSGGK